jgi:hypothetical protein
MVQAQGIQPGFGNHLEIPLGLFGIRQERTIRGFRPERAVGNTLQVKFTVPLKQKLGTGNNALAWWIL